MYSIHLSLVNVTVDVAEAEEDAVMVDAAEAVEEEDAEEVVEDLLQQRKMVVLQHSQEIRSPLIKKLGHFSCRVEL